MSEKRDDGGPAFPCMTDDVMVDPKAGRVLPVLNGGMTLRDWFAGQAISVVLAEAAKHGPFADVESMARETLGAAGLAYLIADAMLEVRRK